jgi:hypothetical protein
MGESRLLELQLACGWSDAQLFKKLGFSGHDGCQVEPLESTPKWFVRSISDVASN